MADRLTGMDVFVRAIRLGGISAAARDLHMSPAMAAKHLGALEARLGTTLVQRSTRRLSLTEAGADYFEKAERILMEIGEAEAEASSRSITAQGLLRVSAPATFGVLHLASLVPAFSARHPEVTIELGFNDRYVVNRRPKGTPYRRAKGTPFVEQRDGYDGRAVRAGCGVGRA